MSSNHNGLPAKAIKLDAGTTYNLQALAFATARQPNTLRPTQVITTISIASPDAADGSVAFEVSPDNAAWTTIGSWRNFVDTVGGGGGPATNNRTQAPATFVVPAGYYYRLTTTTFAGAPTYTVVSNFELTL